MTALVQILAWKPRPPGGVLRGHLEAQFPSEMIFRGVGLFERDGQWWAVPGAKPRLDREGRPVLGADGKRLFDRLNDFATKRAAAKWSDSIVGAMRVAYPEVFE